MAYENLIAQALGGVLKNPVLNVMKLIKLPLLLKRSGLECERNIFLKPETLSECMPTGIVPNSGGRAFRFQVLSVLLLHRETDAYVSR